MCGGGLLTYTFFWGAERCPDSGVEETLCPLAAGEALEEEEGGRGTSEVAP